MLKKLSSFAAHRSANDGRRSSYSDASNPKGGGRKNWRFDLLPNGGFKANVNDILSSNEYKEAVEAGRRVQKLQQQREKQKTGTDAA